MSKRELSDWLTAYLEYTDRSEPPTSYHTWTAVSLISAALQRKCYLRWGYETIYPNVYVILVGPSGRTRKGTALNIGKDIVQGMGIKMVAEAITKEALIQDMSGNIQTFNDPSTNKMMYHCSVFVMSDELSVFLGQGDVQFLSHLTDWYDSRNSWTYRTKGSGTDEIQGVCMTLLAATAPDWIPSMFPIEAIGGGFTSRVIFIVEERKRRSDPTHMLTPEEVRLRDLLVRDLERIHNMKGEYKFEPEAKEFYEKWYIDYETSLDSGKSPIDDPRFLGYLSRRATHLRKLSMLVSASHSDSRIITVQDFERSLRMLRTVESKMAGAFGGTGSARHSHVTDKVLQYIMQRKKVNRSTLLRQFRYDLDMEVLSIVEGVLVGMKAIRLIRNPMTGDTTYIYEDSQEQTDE